MRETPSMTSQAFLDLIRNDGALARLPVIVMSGSAHPENQAQYCDAIWSTRSSSNGISIDASAPAILAEPKGE